MVYRTLINFSQLASWKSKALRKSKSLPEYYISVESWNYDQKQKYVLYTVEIGVLLKIDKGEYVMIFTFDKRYSELRAIYKSIRKSLTDETNHPPFPPKKYIGNLDREFITDRFQKLQNYFSELPLKFRVETDNEFTERFSYSTIYSMWRSGIEAAIHNKELPF